MNRYAKAAFGAAAGVSALLVTTELGVFNFAISDPENTVCTDEVVGTVAVGQEATMVPCTEVDTTGQKIETINDKGDFIQLIFPLVLVVSAGAGAVIGTNRPNRAQQQREDSVV